MAPFSDRSTELNFGTSAVDVPAPAQAEYYLSNNESQRPPLDGDLYQDLPIIGEESIDTRLRDFWSTGKTVVEAAFTGQEFCFRDIGKAKFFIRVKAAREERDVLYERLVQRKHLHDIATIEYCGSVDFTHRNYSVDTANCITTVQIPALASEVQDNTFIETYLNQTFGEYAPFIRQYIAAFAFSNFKKLPTLVLTGPRGSGKSTFAELVASIFPSLSMTAHELTGTFTPHFEKKLLIIDEALRTGPLQYTTLKKLAGQEHFTVNKKYKSHSKVRNNISLIILSNDPLPLLVNANELPTDTRNNQFFVFEFRPFTGPIDPLFAESLRKRLGHYLRTEIREVFDSLPTACRYSVEVPITEAERRLFQNSADDTDLSIQILLDRIQGSNSYLAFLDQGLLPVDLLHCGGRPRMALIQRLWQKGLCQNGSTERLQVGGVRKTCLRMTPKFRELLKPPSEVIGD